MPSVRQLREAVVTHRVLDATGDLHNSANEYKVRPTMYKVVWLDLHLQRFTRVSPISVYTTCRLPVTVKMEQKNVRGNTRENARGNAKFAGPRLA